MYEIKCPKCNEIFTIDESGYAAIAAQVRDAEFKKEISEREKQISSEKESAFKVFQINAQMEKEKTVFDLEKEIERLNSAISSNEKDLLLHISKRCFPLFG